MPLENNERLEGSILCCCKQHELHNELMKFNLKLQPGIKINDPCNIPFYNRQDGNLEDIDQKRNSEIKI